MPTHAWLGFLHAWHTLGIVLKWMCITVIGIPVALATCIVVALAVLAFGALCLGAAGAVCAGIFYLFKGLWWLTMRIPWWISDWRVRRAERLLLGGLPTTEDRSESRRRHWFGMRYQRPRPRERITTQMIQTPHYRPPIALTPPPPAHLMTLAEEGAAPIQGLPGMIECQVCMEGKWLADFPDRAPTDTCEHEATDCCKPCLAQSIQMAFEGNIWDDIRCPSCNIQLEHKDIREFAAPAIFERYDRLATRQALESIPNFRWCLGPDCEFGQEHPIDPKEDPLVTCTSCSFVQCSYHSIKWHEGETCDEYDARMAAGAAIQDKRTEKIIKKISKRCPGCQRYINKNGGCPHMSCLCGKQFCWNCMHDYPGHSWKCTRRS